MSSETESAKSQKSSTTPDLSRSDTMAFDALLTNEFLGLLEMQGLPPDQIARLTGERFERLRESPIVANVLTSIVLNREETKDKVLAVLKSFFEDEDLEGMIDNILEETLGDKVESYLQSGDHDFLTKEDLDPYEVITTHQFDPDEYPEAEQIVVRDDLEKFAKTEEVQGMVSDLEKETQILKRGFLGRLKWLFTGR